MPSLNLRSRLLRLREWLLDFLAWLWWGFLCIVALCGFALLLSLPGIFAGSPTSGTIHSKDYIPPRSIGSCQTVGKGVICTPVKEPAIYRFDLYASDGQHGWVYVTSKDYATYRVGQSYTVHR